MKFLTRRLLATGALDVLSLLPKLSTQDPQSDISRYFIKRYIIQAIMTVINDHLTLLIPYKPISARFYYMPIMMWNYICCLYVVCFLNESIKV